MIPSGSREPEVRDVHVDHSPLPKRSSHLKTFDPKWNDEFPRVIYLAPDQDNGPSMLCRYAVNIMSRLREWSGSPFLASFSVRISCASTSNRDAMLMQYKPKL